MELVKSPVILRLNSTALAEALALNNLDRDQGHLDAGFYLAAPCSLNPARGQADCALPLPPGGF